MRPIFALSNPAINCAGRLIKGAMERAKSTHSGLLGSTEPSPSMSVPPLRTSVAMSLKAAVSSGFPRNLPMEPR